MGRVWYYTPEERNFDQITYTEVVSITPKVFLKNVLVLHVGDELVNILLFYDYELLLNFLLM